jgi:RNA polymerase sigma-70 factor (ECF subfamily)
VRSHRPRPEVGVDATELPCSAPDPEQAIRIAEDKRFVHLVLAAMPEPAAMLIRWHDLEDQTHDEIAAILGIPLGTVKSRHHDARDQFRTLAKRLHAQYNR